MMFSYRFMQVDMQGSRIGSRRTSARQTVGTIDHPGQFMIAPASMPMDMHMFSIMYGLSDNITLMGMTSLVNNEMDHLVRNGRTFTTEASGLGNTMIGAMIRLMENNTHKIHWNLSISLPTESTNERDDTPAMANTFLPYPMQLGSGTFDLLPGITYIGKRGDWRWGGQLSAVIRTGDNDEGYTLGDRFAATGWLSRDLSNQLSMSLRFNYQDWDNIDGQNIALNPNVVQTANTALQGGDRVDVSVGLNYLFKNGHRLAIEYGVPIS